MTTRSSVLFNYYLLLHSCCMGGRVHAAAAPQCGSAGSSKLMESRRSVHAHRRTRLRWHQREHCSLWWHHALAPCARLVHLPPVWVTTALARAAPSGGMAPSLPRAIGAGLGCCICLTILPWWLTHQPAPPDQPRVVAGSPGWPGRVTVVGAPSTPMRRQRVPRILHQTWKTSDIPE